MHALTTDRICTPHAEEKQLQHAHSDEEMDMEGYSVTIKQDEENDNSLVHDPDAIEIAFAASAGVFVYQMGVAAYLQDHFDLSKCHFSGCSGGAWAATLLASETDVRSAWQAMADAQRRTISGTSWYSGYGRYANIVMEAIQSLWKDDPDVHLRVQKRHLSIAVTKFPSMQPEKHTSWENLEDLMKSILSSALVPFALTGKPCIQHRGQWYIDGAFTNFKGVKCEKYSTWSDLYFHTAQTVVDTIKTSTDAISNYLLPSWTKPIANYIHNALPTLESPHEVVAPTATSVSAATDDSQACNDSETDAKRPQRILVRPWEWRSHSVTAFHLSVDLATHRERFEMGYQDALNHHHELAAVLPPKVTKKHVAASAA